MFLVCYSKQIINIIISMKLTTKAVLNDLNDESTASLRQICFMRLFDDLETGRYPACVNRCGNKLYMRHLMYKLQHVFALLCFFT